MNENMVLNLKLAVTGALSVLTALWGWFGWLVVAWVSLMLADWLVGSAVAFMQGRWASNKLRDGVWHKLGMIVAVCVACITDLVIGAVLSHLPGVTLPFTYSGALGPMILIWYIVGELGSLAEHAVNMGAKVPGWLPRILDISKEAVDAAGDALTHDTHEHTGEKEENGHV